MRNRKIRKVSEVHVQYGYWAVCDVRTLSVVTVIVDRPIEGGSLILLPLALPLTKALHYTTAMWSSSPTEKIPSISGAGGAGRSGK